MLPKELCNVTSAFKTCQITSSWNILIVCVQILVGFGFNSHEHLEGQLVHEERIQSTATDKISTVTFQYLTLIPKEKSQWSIYYNSSISGTFNKNSSHIEPFRF